MRHNFVRLLAESSEFESLNFEDVMDILDDDELNVKNEEIVFEAVKRWVAANPRKRKGYLSQLLQCVRLGTLSTDFIVSIKNWTLIQESKVC